MTKYFAQDTPQASLERMMMSVPGFQRRGGGISLSSFHYKPEDVDCQYCLHYRCKSCQVPTCPYIAERLASGALEYSSVEDSECNAIFSEAMERIIKQGYSKIASLENNASGKS